MHTVRDARPEEFAALGALIVRAYESLPAMPKSHEMPEYYRTLRDVAKRATNPSIRVFVALDDSGELLGSVDFIHDLRQYGATSAVRELSDAAGIRLLAVDPARRGLGVGKELTRFCIEQARALGKARVVLHTTRAMDTAWAMYERLGFVRFPQIDFQQGSLEVFGFRLAL